VFVSEVRIRQAHHKAVADDVPILSTHPGGGGPGSPPGSAPVWLPVFGDSEFRLHQKRNDTNAPPTLRVEYMAGFSPYSEYISFESANTYALSFAHKWWFAMGGCAPVPMSVAEAIVRRSELGRVTEIQVSREGQWWRINRRRVLRTDGMLVEIDSKYRSSQIPPPSEVSEITSPLQTSSETLSSSEASSEINAA
jgi:hypothetical protein